MPTFEELYDREMLAASSPSELAVGLIQAANRRIAELENKNASMSRCMTDLEDENAKLEEQLREVTAHHEVTKRHLQTALLATGSDRSALAVTMGRYLRLETVCWELLRAYGEDSVAFHRNVAQLRGVLGNER